MYYIIGDERRYYKLYSELENFVAVDILNIILERVQVLDESYGEERNLRKTWEVIESMMGNEVDFTNYYSNPYLVKTKFYSIVNSLYELNNLWMLSEFIRKNRHLLWNEVREIEGESGKTGFSVPRKLGKDTILSRMFQVMKIPMENDSRVAAEQLGYAVNLRRLKVYAASSGSGQNVAQIILQGI